MKIGTGRTANNDLLTLDVDVVQGRNGAVRDLDPLVA
jgi:hypothetical protein